MKSLSFSAICAAAFLAGSSALSADTSSMTVLSGNYAAWDIFPTYAYTDLAPDASGGSTAFTISQSFADPSSQFIPSLLDGGDAIYTGGGAAIWTISGVAGTDFDSLRMQVRYMNTTDITPTLNYNGDAFSATIGTATADGTYFAVGFGSFDVFLNEWTWSGLNIAEGDAFTISFATGSHKALDAIAVQVIPEPSTYALLAMSGIGGLLALRRRRVS